MDTITHGMAGALISKAICRGDEMFTARPMNRQRVITWALMFGAIFPDSDTLRDYFSSDTLLIITWHRSLTHSLVCLMIWAILLAALTRWFTRWRNWDAPSFVALTGIYAVGILSHILLDLVTSFGTMVWSPVKWSRPAWDLIFIIDFTFTAMLLLPQLLAWVYANPEKLKGRAISMAIIFLPLPVLIFRIAENVGAPIAQSTVFWLMLFVAALFLLPGIRGWGLRVPQASWNRTGFAAACIYIALAVYAHHAALERVQKFAALEHLDTQTLGALPFPPSIWHWDGLIRVPHGVYELRINLGDAPAAVEQTLPTVDRSRVIEYRFYPDAFSNSYIEAAKRLPEVQKVLWFSRFPVTRFRKEDADAIVEISDLRFPQVRPDRSASFTYRVRFDAAGNVLSQGWAKP